MKRSLTAVLALAALGSMALTPVAQAQQYPSKPVRMLIPSPAGGGTDILGRVLRDGFADALGQPVIVDNRGGASGRIAAAFTAKAAPDGYTLLFTYGGVLTTGLPLFKDVPYHPIRDFTPIAMMCHVPTMLVAHPTFPAKSVQELIAMAKAKPGAITAGASSLGSSSHLNMELFKQMAGIDMLTVAFNGDAGAMQALLGNQVPFAFNNLVVALPHLQSGKLKPLGMATAQRLAEMPDVPTIAESGVPGYEGLLFYGLVGPGKLPPAIVSRLHETMQKVKQLPETKAQMTRLGAVSLDMTSAQFGEYIQKELAKWTKVIQAGNIKAE